MNKQNMIVILEDVLKQFVMRFPQVQLCQFCRTQTVAHMHCDGEKPPGACCLSAADINPSPMHPPGCVADFGDQYNYSAE